MRQLVQSPRQEGCHQCLLIMSRHPNLLQYKESYCIGPESMQSLCSKIRVEAVLYTIIRDLSPAAPCPFRNAFHFIYNNNSGGVCREPVSYIHQCASESRFRFFFRKCPKIAYSFDRDVQLECLANWRDGSDEYLYGQFLLGEGNSKEETLRCFMYTALGTVLYLSMSADATCRGLRSSRDGPLVLELTEDSHGWPQPQCSLPQWFNSSSPWSDLSRRQRLYALRLDYPSGTGGASSPPPTTLYYYHKTNSGVPSSSSSSSSFSSSSSSTTIRTLASFKCVRTIFGNSSGAEHDAFVMLAYVLDDCQPHYQCLKLQRRQFYIAEIQKSDYFADPNHKCAEPDFTDLHSAQLIMSQHGTSGSCPFEGRYKAPVDGAGCQLQVAGGCEDKSRLDITSSCQTQPILRLSCLLWWNEGQTLFFLARSHPLNASDRITCYVLRNFDDVIEITSDTRCSQETPSNSQNIERYRFNNYLDECPPEPFHSEISRSHMIIEDYQPENGYRYVVSGENSNKDGAIPAVKTFANASGQNNAHGNRATPESRTNLIVLAAVTGVLLHNNCKYLLLLLQL